MHVLEARAESYFPREDVIVWEGDPETFQFSYVGRAAERVLGYPCSRWTSEPTFWADVVVHPDDRRDAVAYCALATCKGSDHVFEYRAVRRDGSIVWLVDVVRVVLGSKRLPVALRGAMFDVSSTKRDAGTFDQPPEEGAPSRGELADRPDAAAG
jgi:PAS domain-containing protein